MSSVKVRALFVFVVIRRDKSPTVFSALSQLGHVYRKAIF
jgi:hypothetical protein